MESHRMLTAAGAVLLVATFLINAQHAELAGQQEDDGAAAATAGGDMHGSAGDSVVLDAGDVEFNYAYVTGIAMIAAFVGGFAIFTKQKMKRGFAS